MIAAVRTNNMRSFEFLARWTADKGGKSEPSVSSASAGSTFRMLFLRQWCHAKLECSIGMKSIKVSKYLKY